PDDEAAIAHLQQAVDNLRQVFAKAPGLTSWGDILPHHPMQTPEMSYDEIQPLHERPAKLDVWSLSMEEVDYFFAHAGYTLNARKTLRPAVQYFLPRYARYFAEPDTSECVGVTTDVQLF